jgi:hemoglobin-like flavoprotein
MTTREIIVVKKSWQIISKINPILVGDVFYSKLFLETPELRRLFTTDRAAQSRKLVLMLTTIVSGLDRLGEFMMAIKELAIRHKQYGVEKAHYQKVGVALLWTLEKALGHDFDAETKQAWTECYTLLSDVMIKAVEEKSVVKETMATF